MHDPSAALEYAARLKAFADSKGLWKNLFIVMRVCATHHTQPSQPCSLSAALCCKPRRLRLSFAA